MYVVNLSIHPFNHPPDLRECDFSFVYYRVPESELSLAHPGESCGEDVSVSGEDGSHWSDPIMWSQTFLLVSRATMVTTRNSSYLLDVFQMTALTSLFLKKNIMYMNLLQYMLFECMVKEILYATIILYH